MQLFRMFRTGRKSEVSNWHSLTEREEDSQMGMASGMAQRKESLPCIVIVGVQRGVCLASVDDVHID